MWRDWSSDVCSSDLPQAPNSLFQAHQKGGDREVGCKASCVWFLGLDLRGSGYLPPPGLHSRSREPRLAPTWQVGKGKPREVVQGSNVTTHVKWLSLTGPEETLNSKFPFGHFYRRRWHRVSNLSLLNSLWNLPVQHRYTPHYIPHSCRHTSSGWFQPCTFPSLSSGHLWPDAVPPWCNAWGSTQIPRYGLISAGETK